MFLFLTPIFLTYFHFSFTFLWNCNLLLVSEDVSLLPFLTFTLVLPFFEIWLSLYLSLTSLAASPRISSACCRAPGVKVNAYGQQWVDTTIIQGLGAASQPWILIIIIVIIIINWPSDSLWVCALPASQSARHNHGHNHHHSHHNHNHHCHHNHQMPTLWLSLGVRASSKPVCWREWWGRRSCCWPHHIFKSENILWYILNFKLKPCCGPHHASTFLHRLFKSENVQYKYLINSKS